MATPKIIADFETQLATAIAIGDTSFTLATATDDDGVALPAGEYYFTVNAGASNKEYLFGTLSGTSITGVSNVTRQGVESSGSDRAHRVGDSIKLTDFNTYKKYIDETTVAGSADASTSVKGVVEAATLTEVRAGTGTGGTGAVLAVTPDVLDDLPTEDEKTVLTSIEDGSYFAAPTVETFTSSGTWTKDSGLVYVVVEVQAAGGGGGGGPVNDSGAGGGGGGYSRKLIAAASLGATETVTIGAGGAAGTAAGDDAGSTGGSSSFGSLSTATGGAGGGSTDDDPGAGGIGSSGDINITGGGGQIGSGSGSRFAGCGGSSHLGGGGSGNRASAGDVGGVYGGGGGGGSNDTDGGAGGAGIVIVTEYYT